MNKTHTHRNKGLVTKKYVFAALVIIAGLSLFLFNVGVLPEEYKTDVFNWKTIILCVGFINLFSKESRPIGVILSVIALSFMFGHKTDMPIKIQEILIPLVLVLLGMLILFKKKKKFKVNHEKDSIDESVFEEINFFSGSKRMFTGPVFKGGSIINVFGGSEIDLRSTCLSEDKSVIELICVFGGGSFIVPDDWTVKFETISILGGFADKRSKLIQTESNKVLVIKGLCVFGGGEVKTTESCDY